MIYAQWAVESMFHISLSLKFKTKILDIAYLLLLKLMKEPGFQVDYQFVRLYIKVLAQQGKYKEALDFMGLQSQFFNDKVEEKQKLEIDLYFRKNDHVPCMNTLFAVLRHASQVANYNDRMWPMFQQCIRIVIDDHMPKKEFEFRVIDFSQFGTENNQTYNFDEITEEDVPEKILKIVYNSVKNIRKNTMHIDPQT